MVLENSTIEQWMYGIGKKSNMECMVLTCLQEPISNCKISQLDMQLSFSHKLKNHTPLKKIKIKWIDKKSKLCNKVKCKI
jgi:hypothetical protein